MIKTLEEWTSLGIKLEVYFDDVYIQRWEYRQYAKELFNAIDIKRFEQKIYITLANVNQYKQ